MYKEEIKELYSKKKEEKKIIVEELIVLYLKLKIGYPNLDEEKNAIISMMKYYLKYDKLETDILKEIKKQYGDIENNENVEYILDYLDSLSIYYYEYIDQMVLNYEQVIETDLINLFINRFNGKYHLIEKEKYRISLPVMDQIFIEEDKDKLLKMIRRK